VTGALAMNGGAGEHGGTCITARPEKELRHGHR
jgi:hypothetical protein